MSAEETVKEAIDVVDQTLDILENTEPVQVFRNNPAVIVTVAALGLAVGAGAGYLVARKMLRAEYDQLMKEEVERTKEYYSIMHKKEGYETPQSALEARLGKDAVEALRRYNGNPSEVVKAIEEDHGTGEEDVQENNIFVNNQPVDTTDWDYEVEQASRDTDYPYIISHEEYLEAEPGFEQVVFTYYEGDDVLADEQDKAVNDTAGVVGDDNLMKFGHGSGQANVVYVRNEKLGLDFEIVKSGGKYTEEVLGFIEHSDRPRSRRARWGDDE